MSSNKPLETPTHSSPGAMLRRAREKAGVTLKEVSAQTLIPLSRLEALEKDDLELVGGNAYVVGYARNAAESMGVDPKPIVDAFIELVNANNDQNLLAAELMKPVTKKTVTPKDLKKLLIIVGFALLAVIASLGYIVFSTDEGSGNNINIEVGNKQQEPSTSSVKQKVPIKNSETSVSLQVATQSDVEEEETSEPIDDVEESVYNSSYAVDEVVELEDAVEQSPENEAMLSNTLTEGESLELNAEATLTLFFTDECWVQVTDASGKRLTAQVANSGDHLTLEGLTPFDVMLGNAKAVLIELNGESVTVVPHPNKRTLRLTVGG